MRINNYNSYEDTINHKQEVENVLCYICDVLSKRAVDHDNSKLESPEKEIFDLYTPKLKNTTYGSDEYKNYLKEMQVALKHHYSNNSHHPEHHKNGIKDMDLVDLIEMIADWYAATKRHDDGNIIKSLEINQSRFNYSDELKQIFTNTINNFDLK